MEIQKQKIEMIKSVTLNRDELALILQAYNILLRFAGSEPSAEDVRTAKKVTRKLGALFDFCRVDNDFCGDSVLPDHPDTNTVKKYVHECDKEAFAKKWKSDALI